MFSLQNQKALLPVVFLAITMASSPLTFAQSAMAQQPDKQPEWMYRGSNGVAHWGGIPLEYSPCADGKYQSPINIYHSTKNEAHQVRLAFQRKRPEQWAYGGTGLRQRQPG